VHNPKGKRLFIRYVSYTKRWQQAKKNLASIENPTKKSQPHILALSVFATT
jgi:hypothetical protein